MRRFFLILLSLMLIVCSAHASSLLGLDLDSISTDLIVEHKVFLTADTDDYTEVIVLFYGHDTHKLVQINDEVLFSKDVYSVELLQAYDPEQMFPGIHSMSFASVSVEEMPKAISYLISFTKLNDPENFNQALQNGILTGSFPNGYATVEDIEGSIDGREMSATEYGGIGLHFDVK